MLKETFCFKEFKIDRNRSAMKVGTDGVLLGLWTSMDNNPSSILDIRAGTGLITLILAQRSQTETIDAIEIDKNAFEQNIEFFKLPILVELKGT